MARCRSARYHGYVTTPHDIYQPRLRAAVYLRISNDPEGLELGTTRQRQDCLAYLEARGYTLVHVYTDNDRSASRYAKRIRPEYRDMLSDARAGKFDVIVAYTSSRVTRKPREHEDLIDLAEDHGIRFDYLRSPAYDLGSADGVKMARYAAADDAAEVHRTSERASRDVRRRAEAGAFHGGQVPFGFDPTWGMVNRQQKVIGFEVNQTHKTWIAEAARRVLAGETTYAIVKDWNDKHRRTQTGRLWTQRALTRILVNPASAGLRQYNGETFPAPWPELIAPELHQRLVTLLTDPARAGSTDNRRKYMMSGLVYCGRCGNLMTSTSPKSAIGYQPGFECSKMKTGRPGCGRMKIVMEALDQYVTAAVFHALEESEAFAEAMDATIANHDGAPAEELAARADVNKWELSLANLVAEKDDPDIKMSADEYKARRLNITGKLEDARQALARTTRTAVKASLPPVDELRAQWNDRDPAWRRVIVSAVLERVDVSAHPRGVSSAPPRRNGEPETAWRARFDMARMATMAQRVDIRWLA